MAREGADKVLEKSKTWYPVLAILYYGGAILAVISAVLVTIATAIVNYANKSQKDLENFVEPFGTLFSPSAYVFLIEHRWAIIIACGTLVMLFAFIFHRRLRRRLDGIYAIDDVAREYCLFLFKLRESTIESIKDGKMSHEQYEEYSNKAYAEVDKFFILSVTRIAALFEQITGNKCHVSVKLFDTESKKIRTRARDDSALTNRAEIDKNLGWYEYSNNTAFLQILDDENAKFFLSNNLRFLSVFKKYKNSNPDWKALYTACMVVPITGKTHGAQINHESVLGFLCVDNLGGGFDKKVGLQLLYSFARMYEFVFIAAAALKLEKSTTYSK